MTINWLHWISSSFVCWTKVWDKSTNHSDVWRPCSLYLRLYHPSRSTGLHFPDGLVWLLEGTSPNLMLSKCLEPPSLGAFPIPINSPSIYHFFTAWPSQSAPYVWDFLSSSQLQAQELGMIPFFLALDTWLRIRRLRLHGVTWLGGIELHVKRLQNLWAALQEYLAKFLKHWIFMDFALSSTYKYMKYRNAGTTDESKGTCWGSGPSVTYLAYDSLSTCRVCLCMIDVLNHI
jgi:hypothetical protein